MRIELVDSSYVHAENGVPVRLTVKGRAAMLSALAAGNEVVIKVDQHEIVVSPPVRH